MAFLKKSALTCALIYLSISTSYGQYNGDGSRWLKNFKVLDCYGTMMSETFEEEYTDVAAQADRTLGWAALSDPTTLVPDDTSKPVGRIVNVDFHVERPCFFTAQMGGGDYESTNADKANIMVMAVNHSNSQQMRRKWQDIADGAIPDIDTANDHAVWAANALECVHNAANADRRHDMCAAVHFLTDNNAVANSGLDENNGGLVYDGFNTMCATFVAAMTSGSNEYAAVAGGGAAPKTSILSQVGDLGANRGDTVQWTINLDDSSGPVAGDDTTGMGYSVATCSAILATKEEDNDEEQYADPSKVGILAKGHNNAGTNTIPENGRLFWQANFHHSMIVKDTATGSDGDEDNLCATKADPGCRARRVNVIMGEEDAAANGVYLTWAEKAGTATTPRYINRYAYSFWIQPMPELAGNTWSNLRAYTEKVSIGDDCSAQNCPVTIQDPDSGEMWVGVSVENPVLNEVVDANQYIYVALSSSVDNSTLASTYKTTPANILTWYGGITRVAPGRCKKGSAASPNRCAFGVYHGYQDFSDTNTVSAVCNTSNADYSAGTADVTCSLLVCLWPNYKCTFAQQETPTGSFGDANYHTLDADLGVGQALKAGSATDGDADITMSDPTVWHQVNGQGDGSSDPAANNTRPNIIHVPTGTSKDFYVEVTTGNQNYPVIFQRQVSRNTTDANDTFYTVRPSDTINWGIEGNVDIKYPATAWATGNGRVLCDMDANPADGNETKWNGGTAAGPQEGCGLAYNIGTVAERLSDPRMHDFSLSNLHLSFGNQYDYNIMHFNHQFTSPTASWVTLATPVRATKWAIYTQTKNELATYTVRDTSGNDVAASHKPRYARLHEMVYEYKVYSDGDSFITNLQLGSGTANKATSSDQWYSGSQMRELTADSSRTSNVTDTTDPMRIAQYSFSDDVTFGFHLTSRDTEILLDNATVYFVNKTMYTEDAPIHNSFGGLMGECSRPAWANSTGKNKYYAAGQDDDTDFVITLSNVSDSNCDGLSDGTVPEACFSSKVDTATRSLLRGEYEIWVQNDLQYFFYEQTNSKATFTVNAYTHSDTTFIDSSSLTIGGEASPYSWKYNDASIGLKYTQNTGDLHQTDQIGFILINSTTLGSYKMPNEIDATDILYTTGKYYQLMQNASDCVFRSSSILSDLNTATGVDILPCVNHFGIGTYKIFVQPVGAEKYIKQTTDFAVRYPSSGYEASPSDIIKKVSWRKASNRVTDGVEEKETGEFLFDGTQKAICDMNAEEGSRYQVTHDAFSAQEYMTLEITAGSELNADDLCYIQILDETGGPTAGINGGTPPISDFNILRHPYLTQTVNAVTSLRPVAVECQNGPTTGRSASKLTSDQKTTNVNYHQIPPIVVKQFRPGYQLQMWARQQNKKWTKQTMDGARLILNAFTASSSANLITAIAAPEGIEQLEVPSNGSAINYAISSTTTLPTTSDIVQVCLKPDLTSRANNTFLQRVLPDTVYCGGDVREGPKIDHSIGFTNSDRDGMPPGKYNIMTKFKDVNDGSAATDNLDRTCANWAQEAATVTVEWKRDPSMTADQIWTGEGVAIDRGGTKANAVYKTTNVVGTGTVDDQEWPQEMNIVFAETGLTEEAYKFKLRYPSVLFDDRNYWLYWSQGGDDSCDCSKNLCSDFTMIDTKYLPWPNVGRPNCQEYGRAYESWFPATGVYQLCVTKDENLRGWPVKTTKNTIKTPITLSINPQATPAPAPPSPSGLPSSSSTVATLFALAAAVIGALIL